jgi:uncharacterized iron-regulated membrane protein
MSYEDPNLNRPQRIEITQRNNTGMWIAGLVAVFLVVGLVVFATTRTTNETATTQSPATTTTGSGAATTSKPAQPAKPLPNEKAPAAPPKQ